MIPTLVKRSPPSPYADALLCHDDQLSGRRIAFALYLVPEDWALVDGGTLDVFASNADGPTHVERRFVPATGKLVIFKVSSVSFHRVSEVVAQSRTRVAISGWFHGPEGGRARANLSELSPTFASVVPLAPLTAGEPVTVIAEWRKWINDTYLDGTPSLNACPSSVPRPHVALLSCAASAMLAIAAQMEQESEIDLPSFLRPEVHAAVLAELRENEVRSRPV